jgi:hypothetical protein
MTLSGRVHVGHARIEVGHVLVGIHRIVGVVAAAGREGHATRHGR